MNSERLTSRCLLTMVLLAFAPVGLASVPELPELTEADLASAITPENPETDMMVCKRFTPTGSRIYKRICLPQKEWLRLRDSAQRDTRNARRVSDYVRYQNPDG